MDRRSVAVIAVAVWSVGTALVACSAGPSVVIDDVDASDASSGPDAPASADGSVTDVAATCRPPRTECSDGCVDTKSDRANCGACGTVCASGLVCTSGTCALECSGGTTRCGDACRDLSIDRANCGACNHACDAGHLCVSGACVLSCPPGQVECGGTCVDPNTSRAHCGATLGCGADGGTSGTPCNSGEVCAAGVCALSCPSNLVECGGACIDPQTDSNHCGATSGCGTDGGSGGVVCAAGTKCAGGACAVTCAPGFVVCGSVCVDPATSRDHCGATAGCGADAGTSGTACAEGHVCAGGTCVLSCPPGMSACNGTCIDATAICGPPGTDAGLDDASVGADASDASADVDAGPDYCNGVYDYDFSGPKQVTMYQTDLLLASHPRGYVHMTSCATGSMVAGLGDSGISTALVPAGKYRVEIVKIDTVPPDYPSYYDPSIAVEPPWPLPPATPIVLPASGGGASERVVSSTAGNWTYVLTVPPESAALVSIFVTIDVPEPADFGVYIGGPGGSNSCGGSGMGPNRMCATSLNGVPAGDYTITTNVQPGGKFGLGVTVQ